jgi:hypothetical protein
LVLKAGEDFNFVPSPDDPKAERGMLIVEDHIQFFPADGMHRSAAIKDSLLENTALSGQNVASC